MYSTDLNNKKDFKIESLKYSLKIKKKNLKY